MQTAAQAKFEVVAVDNDDASVNRGMGMIKKSLETIAAKAVQKGTVKQEDAAKNVEAVLSRIRTGTKRGDLADCDLVIEAVPETMEIKTPVYQDFGRILKPSTIIATNTSGLPVKAMADLCGRHETTIGLHYFNPVQLMGLVEVVKLDSTPQGIIDAATGFVKAIGKTPVLCKDTPGFVVNRLLVPYMAQALKLVEDGVADFKDVDAAMKLGAGYPMGPFQLSDYVGLDTTFNILTNWTKMYPGEPAFFVPKILEQKVKEGKLGRKSGEGFYKWKGNQIAE